MSKLEAQDAILRHKWRHRQVGVSDLEAGKIISLFGEPVIHTSVLGAALCAKLGEPASMRTTRQR